MAVITISRQFGAGGKTLGVTASEELGYRFVNDEIINWIAKKARVSVEWVKAIEKEAGRKLDFFISKMISKRLLNSILGHDQAYIDEKIYFNLLGETIRKTATEGNAVILGRGGQFFLKDSPDTFHIHLVATDADRIKFLMENYDLSRKHAEQVISSEEKRRAEFYRALGHKDYEDSCHYDLVLNTSRLTLKEASMQISGLVSCEESKCQSLAN